MFNMGGISVLASKNSSMCVCAAVYVQSLFRNKRFALNEMFQQNDSKFAIFYV